MRLPVSSALPVISRASWEVPLAPKASRGSRIAKSPLQIILLPIVRVLR